MSERRVKIILLGESNVGKSSIVNQFINGTFYGFSCSTIGIDITRRKITVNGDIYIEIWDTAGQERFQTFAINHFRFAERVVLVFDLSNMVSFRQIEHWREEVFRHTGLGSDCMMLVGNKTDLGSSLREVETSVAIDYAEHHGLIYREVSATDGKSIEEMFVELVKMGPVSDIQASVKINIEPNKKCRC